MRMRDRFLPLALFLSVSTMLVPPAIASEADSAARQTGSQGDFCVYMKGAGDTPEIGPLPCDTSRPYMIGHSGFGSSRIPADSEFSSGPKSHIDAHWPPASGESSEPADGTSASPPTGDVDSNEPAGTQAP